MNSNMISMDLTRMKRWFRWSCRFLTSVSTWTW